MPLHIIRKDITTMRVDAIVNTTNEDMVGFSGVDLGRLFLKILENGCFWGL